MRDNPRKEPGICGIEGRDKIMGKLIPVDIQMSMNEDDFYFRSEPEVTRCPICKHKTLNTTTWGNGIFKECRHCGYEKTEEREEG